MGCASGCNENNRVVTFPGRYIFVDEVIKCLKYKLLLSDLSFSTVVNHVTQNDDKKTSSSADFSKRSESIP